MPEKGPSPESEEERQIRDIAEKALFWVYEAPQRHRLKEREAIWRALTNEGIREEPRRTQMFNKVLPVFKKLEYKQNKLQEEVEQYKRNKVLRQAAELEKIHPPDAYGADLLEEDDE